MIRAQQKNRYGYDGQARADERQGENYPR